MPGCVEGGVCTTACQSQPHVVAMTTPLTWCVSDMFPGIMLRFSRVHLGGVMFREHGGVMFREHGWVYTTDIATETHCLQQFVWEERHC